MLTDYTRNYMLSFTHGIRPNAWRGIFHREFSLFFVILCGFVLRREYF